MDNLKMKTMKNVIWKYPLSLGENAIYIPENSQILSFKIQNEVPTIWVLITNVENLLVDRNFLVTGTGIEFPQLKYEFIGTDFIEGSYVWHCFEILQRHPYT